MGRVAFFVDFVPDLTYYNKAARYPQRHGYQLRQAAPSSIIVHCTANRRITGLAHERDFLFSSPDVSAHYLIGKAGEIIQFLDPRIHQAWHAGDTLAEWQNNRSIGIELHHSVPDTRYPAAQLEALAWLLRRLMEQFGIPLRLVEVHGQVAIPGPYDRKKDPLHWPHADFLAWRATLQILDPWAAWGDEFPLPPDQRGWGIPSLWREHAAELGEARSYEDPLDQWTAVQSFQGGVILYERLTGRAHLLKRTQRVP